MATKQIAFKNLAKHMSQEIKEKHKASVNAGYRTINKTANNIRKTTITQLERKLNFKNSQFKKVLSSKAKNRKTNKYRGIGITYANKKKDDFATIQIDDPRWFDHLIGGRRKNPSPYAYGKGFDRVAGGLYDFFNIARGRKIPKRLQWYNLKKTFNKNSSKVHIFKSKSKQSLLAKRKGEKGLYALYRRPEGDIEDKSIYRNIKKVVNYKKIVKNFTDRKKMRELYEDYLEKEYKKQ